MFNDNGAVHEAFTDRSVQPHQPVLQLHRARASRLSPSRMRLAVNNLTDSHAITGVPTAAKTSSLPAPGDLLTVMAGRSVSVSFTVGFLPKNP